MNAQTTVFHSPDLEQQVLGAIMLENGLLDRVSDILTVDHFGDPVHARIFGICLRRISKGHLASPVTLATVLADDEGLKQLGGPKYLVRMAAASMSSFAIRDYAKQMVELHMRRALRHSAEEGLQALSEGQDSAEVKLRLQQALHALPEVAGEESSISLLKATTRAVEIANRSYQGAQKFLTLGIPSVDAILRGLAPGDFMLIGGTTSMGKAQPLDSQVLTLTGWKLMGDVKVGDKLASEDGAASEVIGVFPQGVKRIYRVTFRDGRSVRCCGDHLWRVQGSAMRVPKVVSTHDLNAMLDMAHMKGRIGVPLFRGHFGSDVDLPIHPWVLGAFIGNGCFPEDGNPLLSTADAATLWKFKSLLPAGCEISYAGSYNYRIKSSIRGASPFASAMIGLGLRGKRAENKSIPDVYMAAGQDQRLDLLRGLLDTDGWVEAFGAIRYSTSSKTLADQVAYLVRSIGGVCSISSKMPAYCHNGEQRIGLEHYVLNIRHENGADLFTVMQKKRRCKRSKPVRLGIKSVEFECEAEAQCIAVSHPGKLYVTDDFTLTHNTSLALEAAANISIDQGRPVAFWSLEMSDDQLATRIASARSRIPYSSLRSAEDMSEADFRKWIEATQQISQAPMRIVPKHIRDIAAGHAALRRVKREFGNDLAAVFVDYAQLIRGVGKSRYEQMTDVSISLKTIAGMLECPVVALVQLDRSIGDRDNKRPQLSDIKETGQFENDADQVIFCHREEYWLERGGPKPGRDGKISVDAQADWEADLKASRNLMEVLVRKNRHGGLANASVGFHAPTCRFWALEHTTQREDF